MTHHAKAPSSAPSTRQGSRLGRIFRGALATRAHSRPNAGSGAPAAGLLVTAAALIALALALPTAAAAAPPAVTIEAAANVSYTSAEVKGTVNPEGQFTTWRFQYITDAQFQDNLANSLPGFEGASTAHEEGTETAETLERQLSDLAPATTYHLRLVAENADGQDEALAATFETDAVAKPAISVPLAVSAITTSSAHFSAKVDPGGTDDPAFETKWTITCTPQPCLKAGKELGGSIPAGPAEAIDVDAANLQANLQYTVTLSATNLGGEVEASQTFTTPGTGPTVKAFAAGPVQADQVSLNGQINPHNSPTTYWFEWGTSDCSANPCQAFPASKDEAAGDGPFSVYVLKQLTGLQPNTTYHFRLVAENASGTTEGDDIAFTTAAPEPACANQGALGTERLPDCRAWEMVSPPDKHGVDVIPQTLKTHIAPDANAVTFSAIGAFADPQGTSLDSEYLARRTAESGTNGWSTRAINQLSAGVTFPMITFGAWPTYVNGFAPDLSSAIYRSWHPLTDAPNVKGMVNLYRIDNPGSPSAHAELLTDSVAPLPAYRPLLKLFDLKPDYVGASRDLTHVAFESRLPLTVDTPPQPEEGCLETGFGCPTHLYENADGEVRLVGRVPQGSATECDDVEGPPCVAASSSQAGITGRPGSSNYGFFPQKMISADGRRIAFQSPDNPGGSGALYLREDGVRTVQLAQDGEIWEMSTDGSRVFYITGESLLATDTDTAPDLYMYDAEASGSHLTLLSASTVVDGSLWSVVGASDDGHYVYFVSDGQLLAGEPSAGLNGLYLWHEGELSYIGLFQDANEATLNSPRTPWAVGSAKTSRVSPDGRHLLFMTHRDEGFKGRGGFTGYDHAAHREYYLYSADTGRILCATCTPGGTPEKHDAVTAVKEGATTSAATSKLSHALSDDGRRVFFSTAEKLVSEDTNGTHDAYQYDALTGEVHLISSGTDPSGAYLIDASDDGSDAFFVTRERLSGWDVDAAYDLYDARIGGGLPEPAPVPAPCQGDSCLPTAQPSPTSAPTGSQAAGTGNPPRSCPKDTRRVRRNGKLRCAKKSSRKHQKRANHNRRTAR